MGSILDVLTPSALRGEGRAGYLRLAGHRYQRARAYEWWRGRHDGMAQTRTRRKPVNLTQQQVRTLVTYLAFRAPGADITPLDVQHQWQAKIEATIADKDAKRLNLTTLYQLSIIDCILSGVTFHQVGVKAGGQKNVTGQRALEDGQEFEAMIDFDDITIDPFAKTLREARFIGYRYYVPLSEALEGCEAGQYGADEQDYEDGQLPVDREYIATKDEAREILNTLIPRELYHANNDQVAMQGDMHITTGDKIENTITLWDYVIYDSGQTWIVTMAGRPGSEWPMAGDEKFLAVWRWDGAGRGPLTWLSLMPSPWSIIDMPLEQMQRDLAEVADLIANKICTQLLDTKTVSIYAPGAEAEAVQIRDAKQNAMLKGNPKGVTTHQVGGLIPEMIPGAEWIDQKWEQQGGAMGLASGTRETSERTATAYNGQMVGTQGYMEFLRSRVEDWASANLELRMFYVKANPNLQRMVMMTEGQAPYQVSIPGRLTPESAPISGFTYKVKAYSMTFVDPAVQSEQLINVLTQVVPSIMQLQATMGIDARTAIRMVAEKMSMPELEAVIPDVMWMIQQQMMSQMGPMIDNNPTGDPNDIRGSGPDAARGSRVHQSNNSSRPPGGNMRQGLGARQRAGAIQ